MAKAEKQAGTISMAGLKIGNVRFYERGGKVFARMAATSYMPNKRSGGQMMNRLRFNSVRYLWKSFKDELKGSFEGVELGKSAYTTFMRLNSHKGVFLSKEQQASRFQVVTPLQISEGTLQPILQTINENKQLVSDIVLGDFEITTETSVREFCIALANANPQLEYNDELHLVAVKQDVNQMDTPLCKVEVMSLKLDLADERPLLTVVGKFPLCNKDGYLATNENLPCGCYAFYLSRVEGQKTLVSSQNLASNNDELIEKYISEEQFNMARQSFGKVEEAPIAPWQFEKPTFE